MKDSTSDLYYFQNPPRHRAGSGRVPGRNLFILCLAFTVIVVLAHFGLGPLLVGLGTMVGGYSSR